MTNFVEIYILKQSLFARSRRLGKILNMDMFYVFLVEISKFISMEFLRYTEIKKFDTELQEGQEYCKDWNCFSGKNTVVNSKWNQNKHTDDTTD